MRPILSISLAALLTAAAPATAAEWSPPAGISHITTFISSPTLAFGPRGGALAAWNEQAGLGNAASESVDVAPRDTQGRFGRPRRIGADLVLGGLALDGRGRSLLLGFRPAGRGGTRDGLLAYRGSAGGRFGRPQLIRTAANSFMRTPLLAADSRGAAAAAWRELPRASGQSDVVKLATSPPGGPFGRPRRVSKAGVAAVSIAMGPSGEFVIAWERRGLVEARLGRGDLGPVVRLGPVMGDRAVPRLDAAIDDSGDALVAWESAGRAPAAVWASVAYRRAGHRFGAARQVAQWGAESALAAGIKAAFSARGQAIVAWDGMDAGGFGVFASRASGGVPEAPVRLSPPGLAGFDQLQDVAGLRGRASVAWTHFDPETGVVDFHGHLFATDVDSGGFGAAQAVTPPAVDALDATVRFDPKGGSPVALWRTKTTAQAFGSPREYVASSARH